MRMSSADGSRDAASRDAVSLAPDIIYFPHALGTVVGEIDIRSSSSSMGLLVQHAIKYKHT